MPLCCQNQIAWIIESVNQSTMVKHAEDLWGINSYMIYDGSCFTYFQYYVEDDDFALMSYKSYGASILRNVISPSFQKSLEIVAAPDVCSSNYLKDHKGDVEQALAVTPLFSTQLYCLNLRHPSVLHVLFNDKDISSNLFLGTLQRVLRLIKCQKRNKFCWLLLDSKHSIGCQISRRLTFY